jgi:hypothetical protein
MKAEFERRKAERQKQKPPANPAVRPPAETKAKPAANSYNEKTKEFRCPAGKFTAFMPANPRKQDLKAMGVSLNMYTFLERDGAYAVAYADLPIPSGETSEQTQKRLDGARDGMIRNVGGKLTGESRIWLQSKHPGREVRADIPEKGGVLRARVYLVGTRMYQVAVMGVPSWVNSEEATKVLHSLALTP